MAKTSQEELVAKIAQLEAELRERQSDLKRFREELTQANQRLETLIARLHTELKLAHVAQRALVPTDFPHINGFEFSTKFIPSMMLGGDYFDIFEHEDRFRFGIIVASSSGHAMSALLLGVLLRMTTQIEAKRGSEPHQVLQQMYEQLAPNMTPEDQTDIFYALVDRRNFEMRYVRAGQSVALYQNVSNGEVQPLEGKSGPLALGFQAPTQSSVLFLNPRDRLALCTRGLCESKNRDGENYGIERVTRSFLSGPKRGVHELRNHIVFEVQKFAGGVEPGRDQTLVVVEVKDKVIKLARA